jgi:hypothetical protein
MKILEFFHNDDNFLAYLITMFALLMNFVCEIHFAKILSQNEKLNQLIV